MDGLLKEFSLQGREFGHAQFGRDLHRHVPAGRRAGGYLKIHPSNGKRDLTVVLKPAGGELIIYSPGYEDKEARFSEAESFATMPIAEPILCVKAIGGPFDFNVQVVAIDGVG